MKRIAFLLLFLSARTVISQQSMIDSSINIPYIGISYGLHAPTGDMKDRFGTFSTIGGQFGMKFKSNIHLTFKVDYIFGNDVRETGILDNIRTSEGGIIEVGGELNDPLLSMEGYSATLMAGYIFPYLSNNPNSGFLVSAGIGFMQHKILIDYRNAQIPQLEGAYFRGYDRLSNGFGFNEFIGYVFYGRRKLINFYAGFDLMQTWTKNRRGYNYDEGKPDTKVRHDNSIGFRIGWILTLYRRAPEQYYYH